MKIAVAGGTGRVGRHVVDLLEKRHHDVVTMTRSSGVDVITGQGLVEALAGVECVIDTASGSSPDQQSATAFFTAAAKNLQEAGRRAGVQRMIEISIIGIDRFSAGYMAAKKAHERAMSSGPIPVTILRAAQFHEFVTQLIDWGRQGDVSYLPKMQTQLVAAKTVAEALVEMALDADGSRSALSILEIAGPQPENLVDAATRLVARRGDLLRIEDVTNTADPDATLYEAGALLPGPSATLAGPTFDEWLDETYPVARVG